MTKRTPFDRIKASSTQIQLDKLVVNIELTLISIIQGVALYFLTDRSYDVLIRLQLTLWPYVITGLLIILLFWSRSVIHTLTVIRWPLDLSHNFIYIACTLVETVTFTQLPNTLHWYALNALFGLIIWALFALDLRMIRRRMADSAGPASSKLYAIVEREQLLNIRFFIPASVVFNLLAMTAVRAWTGSPAEKTATLIIALMQTAAAFGYLIYVMRFFTRIVPLISVTRQEWYKDILP